MGSYLNSDGLFVKIGTTKATPNIGGEYVTVGREREIELKIDLTTLTQSEVIQSDQVFVPAGVRIQAVETIAITGAATGTAIDVGLTRTDRSTEIDFDGLLAAAPTANMNSAGEKSTYQVAVTIPTGLTGTGALVGTTTSNVGYISASRTDGTAFTAGVILLKIKYLVP
jgi:hypothetical protein